MAETVRIEIPIETVDNTDPELSNVTKNLESMKKAADSANSSTKKASETVSQFDKTAEKTQKSLAEWAKEKYEILLEAKDKISPVLTTIKSGVTSFVGKAWSVTLKAVDLVTSPVRAIINLLKNPIFQVGTVLGVSFGLADTISTYKDFEAAMSEVQAISGATSSELEKLTAKAKEMGGTTKFTAEESAEAFNYMAMAGWNTEQMLDGIEGILNLAAASGEDLATTSDIVTDALTAFGLQASDAAHFSDVLAKAASSSNTTVSEMGETFKYAASMAGTLGYSIEDVGVMVGLMANSGIKGSSAGTYLNSIMTRLSTNTSGATDAIKELGIDFFDSAGNARDLSDVIDELRAATADYTDEQKANLANTIAGTRAQSGLLAILNASDDAYNELTEAINNADGAAEEMSETMLDNLSGSITLLNSALDAVKISWGERLTPYVRGIADWLTEQMPMLENELDELMDWVDNKIDRTKRKFAEIADTEEWQNADFFGKVKILWDDFIVEPFSEWWNSTGKAKINSIAADIGSGIGTGLKVGILTLLGIDVSETLDEGASIGASFAKGFSEGFDADLIISKLGEGLKNLFSSAATLLPGGESADLSSLLSAAILAKLASPVISAGKGLSTTGKALFGSQESLGGASLMSTVLGSAGTGSGLLGFGANTAITLGAGNLAGGASLSAGALSALGLGAVAGGAVGVATLASSALDAYKAIKSDNADESKAYGESAAWKAGGVAAGAAAGAAIGSIIPGLGTAVGALIGAGVGGIAGWIKGNKVKEEYQENVEEMEALADKVKAVYNATGVTIDDTTKFATKELKDAMHDTELSAEEFASMFQESCTNLMNEAFGNITLSLTEIKKLAEEITFGDMAESLDEFSSAVSATESSLTTLKSSVSDLKRENWKVSLGLELSESEVDSYKQTVDTFVENAQAYIENSHYEATVALNLLTNGEGSTASLDSMYESLTSQIDSLGEQLSDTMEIALSDGVITLDESAELINLQQQITDITSKLTEAQNEAELEAIGIKFKASGADLTAESFASLQEEISAYMQSAEDSYDEALTVTLTNLKLQLSEGAITQEEYNSLVEDATAGYNAQLAELNVNVTSFNLQTIADAYGDQLDGILPDLEGTTAEKLQTALNNALLQKPDVSTWDEDFMKEIFDLDGLNAELQANLESMLLTTAKSTPQAVKDQILQNYEDSLPTVDEIVERLDWENYTTQMYDELTAIIGNTGEHLVGSGSDWSIMDPILDGVSEENLDTAMQNYAENIRSALEANLDPAVVSEFMSSYMTDAMDSVDFADIMSQNGPISNEYYEELLEEWESAGTGYGDALNSGASASILGYSPFLKSDLQTALDTAAENAFYVSPTVNITPNYNVSSGVSGHASGGYVSGGPQLSWLAEEGYGEYVIPTNPSRRTRALELYEQAGEALGVSTHASGGYVSGSNSAVNLADYNLFNEAVKNAPMGYNGVSLDAADDNNSALEPTSTLTEQSGNRSMEISVNVSPEFVINASEGQSEADIMAIIKKNMKAMADEIGGEIAERLEAVFSNMPTVKEA